MSSSYSISINGNTNDSKLVLKSNSGLITEGAAPAPASNGFLPDFESKMDAYLQSVLVDASSPCIGAYVERNGQVYNKAFGVVELSGVDMSVPYTVDTPGAIASSGKLVANIALYKAIEKGWLTGIDHKLKDLDPATFDKPFYQLVGLANDVSATLAGVSDEEITVTDTNGVTHRVEKILVEDLTVKHGMDEAIGLDTNPKFTHPNGSSASAAMKKLLEDANGNVPHSSKRTTMTMDEFINVYWGSGYLMKKPGDFDYGHGVGTVFMALWRYYNNVLYPDNSLNPVSIEHIMNELLTDFNAKVYIFHSDASGNHDPRLSTMKVVKPKDENRKYGPASHDQYATYRFVEHVGANMYMSQTHFGRVLSSLNNGGILDGVRVLPKKSCDELLYRANKDDYGFAAGMGRIGPFFDINILDINSKDPRTDSRNPDKTLNIWGLSNALVWSGARGTRHGILPTEKTCSYFANFQGGTPSKIRSIYFPDYQKIVNDSIN